MVLSALLSRPMAAAGVPAGAAIPNIELTSKPGSPACAAVGTPGRVPTGCAVVVASARSLPLRMCGCAAGAVSIIICTWPPIRSVIAGPLPL